MARGINWFGNKPKTKPPADGTTGEGRIEPVVEGAAEADAALTGAPTGIPAEETTDPQAGAPSTALDEEAARTADEARRIEKDQEEAAQLAAARALEEALAAQATPPDVGARPINTDEEDDERDIVAGVAPPAGSPAQVESDGAPLAGFGEGGGTPPSAPPATEAAGDVLPPPGNGGAISPARKPGILSILFRSAATMAISIGTSIAFKAALAASMAAPSPLLVIGGTVLAVTAAGFAYRRTMDILDYNRANRGNPENMASLVRDFFKPSKTGHTRAKYMNAASASILVSTAGGLIGFTFSEEIKEGLGAAYERITEFLKPETVIEAPPPADIPVYEAPVTDAPKPDAVPPEAPSPEAPAPEALPPAPLAAIVPDAAPVDPTGLPEQPAAGEAPPAILPVEAPPVAEMTSLEQARAALPETPDAILAETLTRLESSSTAVRDQAIKDLGYFFANGLHGVTENDQLANALFESVIHNAQAAHDLGYQLLHGIGAAADPQRALELLTYANENGSTLAAEKLDYMQRMGMIPA